MKILYFNLLIDTYLINGTFICENIIWQSLNNIEFVNVDWKIVKYKIYRRNILTMIIKNWHWGLDNEKEDVQFKLNVFERIICTD